MYRYIYVYIYMHVRMYVCIYIFVCACMCVRVRVHVCVCVWLFGQKPSHFNGTFGIYDSEKYWFEVLKPFGSIVFSTVLDTQAH